MNLWVCLSVGIGGFCGSVLRFLIQAGGFKLFHHGWFGTLVANSIGCFILGFLIASAGRIEWLTPTQRLCLTTGFCGGLTTLSTFIGEWVHLVQNDQYFYATAYLVITITLGALLLMMGMYLAGKLCP